MAKERVSKLNVWFKHFINENCSTTFLNKTESVRRAGYKTKKENSLKSIGCENFTKLNDKISKWLDETGLSENALKIKLLSLMEAKETKFFAFQGEIIEQVEVEAIETQRKTLDMALKVKGMNAPTKHELTGKDGKRLLPRETKIIVEYCKPTEKTDIPDKPDVLTPKGPICKPKK